MTAPVLLPRFVSPESAANYLSVSRTTIYKLIRDGEIHSSLIGSRRVVDRLSLDDYAERHRDRPDPPPPTPPNPGPWPCPDSTT